MKALIVSDDLLFARLVVKRLESWGYEAETVATGSEAHDRLKKEPFRIILMGWDLQGVSGLELTRSIRKLKRSRYSYIIISTNDKSKDIMMAAYEAGADDFLDRPLNSVELKLKMANAKRLLDLEDELRDGAGTDASTGLVNLASFRQFFRVVLAETRRLEEKGVLMYVTVNDFKQVYEEHGYNPAETLMVGVSRALNTITRGSDLVSRIKDDEFCMLLQNTWWDRCKPVGDKVMEKMRNMSLYLEDFELHPTVTIGTVDYPAEDASSEDILATTDRIPFE
jgi:diguanylate cyclase (GGDEF)-like protein